MANPSPEVDAYLSRLDARRRGALERLRQLIRDTVPEAEEGIQFGIPTYRLRDTIAAFAAEKDHMTLYLDAGLVRQNREQLLGVKISGARLQFKRLEQVPWHTVEMILVQTAQRGRATF